MILSIRKEGETRLSVTIPAMFEQKQDPYIAKEAAAIEETVVAESEYEQLAQQLRLRETAEFLNFRKSWSTKLLWLVISIVIFNAAFLLAVGVGWLQYEDEWLVRIIITGGFLEVLGLAKIVVEFLFQEFPATKRK